MHAQVHELLYGSTMLTQGCVPFGILHNDLQGTS